MRQSHYPINHASASAGFVLTIGLAMTETPITFDAHGRMRYHPEFHANHNKPWLAKDERFILDSYYLLGPEECALSLERTIHSVMAYANRLRRQGMLVKPKKQIYFHRTLRSGLC